MGVEITCLTSGPFAENSYLIEDEATKKAAVVDPGWDADESWRPILERKGLTLEKVLLTHGHIDHVSGVAAMARAYPGIPVLIHEIDEPMLSKDNSAAAKMFGLPFEPGEATGYLEEGVPVSVGETEFQVLFVPGHCPGHVALLHGKHLISGDVLFAGSIGRTDLPGCNYHELVHSILDVLLPLGDDVVVYPGHGPTTTIGAEKQNNPFVAEMLRGA